MDRIFDRAAMISLGTPVQIVSKQWHYMVDNQATFWEGATFILMNLVIRYEEQLKVMNSEMVSLPVKF